MREPLYWPPVPTLETTPLITRSQSAGLLLVCLLAGCQGASVGTPAGGRDRPPSVLLVVVDDLTTDLGSYGNEQVETPNLDRLAARGARFVRAYAQFPLCHPSRTSLLSGRYPEAIGVFDNETEATDLPGEAPFLPEHFRRHGYHTARFGKIVHTQHKSSIAWGEPLEDDSATSSPSPRAAAASGEDAAPAERESAPPAPGMRRLDGNRRAVGWRAVEDDDSSLPDGRIARRAVGWIEAHRRLPFFLAVGFNKPHPPFVAPRSYFDLYDPASLELPASAAPADLPAAALDFALLDSGMSELQRRRAVAAYFACVSFVDAQVGLLLDALDRLELWDETIVVVVSDHGMHLGEHGGLWRKLTLFEEALRVPLLIAAPGGERGVAPRAPVELVDLYPTLSELAGLERPSGLQGRSLAPLIRDPKAPAVGVAYSVLGLRLADLARTVRSERFRYVVWPGEGGKALWDLESDPDAKRNLVSDPAYRHQADQLQRLLDARAHAASAPASQSSM